MQFIQRIDFYIHRLNFFWLMIKKIFVSYSEAKKKKFLQYATL